MKEKQTGTPRQEGACGQNPAASINAAHHVSNQNQRHNVKKEAVGPNIRRK